MTIATRLAQPLELADRFTTYVENVLNLVAGSLIFLLMLLGVLQVLLRTLLDSPIFGFIDLVEVGMVGFAVLSISFVQRVGSHVRMELLLQHLKGRWLWTAELMGASAAIFIVAVLIPYSFDHFYRAFSFGDSTIDLELVTWPAKFIVPFALSVLLIRLLVQWLGYLRLWLDPTVDKIAIPIIKQTQEIALEEIRLTDIDSPHDSGKDS